MRLVQSLVVASVGAVVVSHHTSARSATGAELGDPALISSVALPNSGVVLEASNDDTEASIQLAKGLRLTQSFKLFLATKASAPLDGDATTLLTTSGLTDSGHLRLSISPTYWPIRSMAKGPDPEHLKEVCTTYLRKSECTRQELPGEQAKEDFDEGTNYGAPVFGTLALVFGRETFNYRDSATLEAQSRTLSPIAIDASAGVFLPSFGYVGAAYEHLVQFRAGSSTSLCEPYSAVEGVTTCDTATIGKPTRSETNRLSVEARWFTPNFAANPAVRVDLNEWTWTFQVPFYFIANASSAFVGGVAPSYSTESKELTVSVFVGTALSTAPGL